MTAISHHSECHDHSGHTIVVCIATVDRNLARYDLLAVVVLLVRFRLRDLQWMVRLKLGILVSSLQSGRWKHVVLVEPYCQLYTE